MSAGTEVDLASALGVSIDPQLCEMALTHRSYAFEAGGLPTNERLEFLGDAVLGLVVTDLVYHQFPDEAEGRLAKIRAAAVNTTSLASMARGLGVGQAVRLGRGEEASGGRDKDSILADTLEALFGAVYLDHGMEVATAVVRRIFAPLIAGLALRRESLDWKTSLQELVAAELGEVPRYRVTDSGPDHQKHFVAAAVIGDEEIGHGDGRSKKEAEQGAAEEAYAILRARLARAAGDPAAPSGGSDAPASEPGTIGSGTHATGATPPAETGDDR